MPPGFAKQLRRSTRLDFAIIANIVKLYFRDCRDINHCISRIARLRITKNRLDSQHLRCFLSANEKRTNRFAEMRKPPIDHPDAMRLIVEISSIYVACDDCGHSRTLTLESLQKAADLGVFNYMQLCRKIRCSECPKTLPAFRNLTIRPTWRRDQTSQSIA